MKARPTTYRGIKMRSRLEADFARYLDNEWWATPWEYEPCCYGSPTDQYLPDFGIPIGDRRIYYEVKPADVLDCLATVAVLKRMEVIFESEPNALLKLVFWKYEAEDERMIEGFHRNGWDDIWWPRAVPGGRLAEWLSGGRPAADLSVAL